jgi:DNA repair exonuclease SbcCD ATPase subunit
MGMVNKIVNIVVLVLAIACVAFGSMLFKKREQLRFRGDKMAAVIGKVSQTMDKESESDYAKKLSSAKLELNKDKDPQGEENKGKTLHLTNYDNIDNVLKPFEKQVDEVVKQRDELAGALNTVSETLKIPETYGVMVFKSLKTYESKKTSLLGLVEKVNTRDEAVIGQVVSSAGTLGFTVDVSALKDLDNFRPPLSDFGAKVENFKKRLDNYASHISKICSILEVSSPSLVGDDYSVELAGSEDRVKAKKEEFEQTKRELASTKAKLQETEEKLSNAITKTAELEKQIASLNEAIGKYKKMIGGEDMDLGKGPPQEAELARKLVGKVLEVNDKWDFIVIDLGKNNKMRLGTSKKEIFVSLPEGKNMIVSRGDRPVAEVKIVRVNESCSIADVVPGKKYGSIQPGDRVFFGTVEN